MAPNFPDHLDLDNAAGSGTTGAVKRNLTIESDAGKGLRQGCRKVLLIEFATIVDGCFRPVAPVRDHAVEVKPREIQWSVLDSIALHIGLRFPHMRPPLNKPCCWVLKDLLILLPAAA